MRIASIDPGYKTGLAIAEFKYVPHQDRIELKKYSLGTIVDDPAHIVGWVDMARCKVVLMERQPAYAILSVRVPNSVILAKLVETDYTFSPSIKLDIFLKQPLKWIVQIAPSQWKPLMKPRSVDTKAWEPETEHERDAMKMLYYFLIVNYPDRTIVYV